jgi:hypothetical protein
MRGPMKLRQLLSFAGTLCICAVAEGNPLGPNVVHGNVSFGNIGADILQITNSPGSVVNWQSFSIAPGETTRFVQQNAARVQGAKKKMTIIVRKRTIFNHTHNPIFNNLKMRILRMMVLTKYHF